MLKRFVPSPKNLMVLLLVMIFLSEPDVHAATLVFADPNLACAGFSSCFATLQEAINNAGPAPVEVGVFPGVYAESVDLSLMGSAIGEGPGTIVMQALTAAGGATDSGVLISPAAPGGPGTGLGLTTGGITPFVGDIFLFGLTITSPDSSALGVSMIGNLTVADLTVQNAAEFGLAGQVDGDVVLQRIEAGGNGAAGITLSITGNAIIEDIEAAQNVEGGILLAVEQDLTAQTLLALGNENGVELFVCQDADIRDITTRLNQFNGAVISYGPNDCSPSGPVQAQGWLQGIEEEPLLNRTPFTRGGSTEGTLFAADILSEDNGNVGIGIVSDAGVAVLDGLFAYDNLGGGLFLQSQQIELNDSEAIGNQTGMVVAAAELSMTRIVANDSQAMPAGLPSLGAGIFVAAGHAILDELQADNNPLAGLILSNPMDGSIPDYTVSNSQFTANPIGILAEASRPEDPMILVDLVLDTIDLADNLDAGMSIPGLEDAAFSNVRVSGSQIGMDLLVNGQLRVETTNVDANTTGMLMQIEPAGIATVVCSNFSQNLDSGIEMVQGATMFATTNYWGDVSGPIHPGNPGGIGDRVLDAANGGVGVVDYSRFLGQPAVEADCPQGLIEALPVPVIGPKAMMLLILGLLIIAGLSVRRMSGI